MKPSNARVVGVDFLDGDSIRLDWMDGSESDERGFTAHSTVIHPRSFNEDEQVGYYVQELVQDVHELLYWFLQFIGRDDA